MNLIDIFDNWIILADRKINTIRAQMRKRADNIEVARMKSEGIIRSKPSEIQKR